MSTNLPWQRHVLRQLPKCRDVQLLRRQVCKEGRTRSESQPEAALAVPSCNWRWRRQQTVLLLIFVPQSTEPSVSVAGSSPWLRIGRSTREVLRSRGSGAAHMDDCRTRRARPEMPRTELFSVAVAGLAGARSIDASKQARLDERERGRASKRVYVGLLLRYCTSLPPTTRSCVVAQQASERAAYLLALSSVLRAFLRICGELVCERVRLGQRILIAVPSCRTRIA